MAASDPDQESASGPRWDWIQAISWQRKLALVYQTLKFGKVRMGCQMQGARKTHAGVMLMAIHPREPEICKAFCLLKLLRAALSSPEGL